MPSPRERASFFGLFTRVPRLRVPESACAVDAKPCAAAGREHRDIGRRPSGRAPRGQAQPRPGLCPPRAPQLPRACCPARPLEPGTWPPGSRLRTPTPVAAPRAPPAQQTRDGGALGWLARETRPAPAPATPAATRDAPRWCGRAGATGRGRPAPPAGPRRPPLPLRREAATQRGPDPGAREIQAVSQILFPVLRGWGRGVWTGRWTDPQFTGRI